MQTELARRAAKWWADHLRNGAKMDNGATDPSNLMAQSLAGLLQTKERSVRSDAQIQAFEDALYHRYLGLTGNYERMGDCDYDPCSLLVDAAKEADCDLGMASLPWKTSMLFRNGRVEVKCGYGQLFEALA